MRDSLLGVEAAKRPTLGGEGPTYVRSGAVAIEVPGQPPHHPVGQLVDEHALVALDAQGVIGGSQICRHPHRHGG